VTWARRHYLVVWVLCIALMVGVSVYRTYHPVKPPAWATEPVTKGDVYFLFFMYCVLKIGRD
jgi:hypothetical protein